MSVKSVLLMIVSLLTFVAFGQIGLAGTWIDDFSDRTLWDWGGTEGFENEEFRAGVDDGRLNFRGRRVGAYLDLTNFMLGKVEDFKLEMKFMVRNILGPESSSWGISYYTYNEETGKYEGMLDFQFQHVFDDLEEQDLASIRIVVWEVMENPHALTRRFAEHLPLAYEKEIWYTLKIDAVGNQYTFSVGDTTLKAEDSSVPAGWIEFRFRGRCNIWLDDFTVTGPNVPDGGPGFARAVFPVGKLSTTWGKLKSKFLPGP